MEIRSIKDSTKATYVWLFASVASSLYVNGRKVHFTKVCRFPAALGDVSAFQPDPVSAAGTTQT